MNNSLIELALKNLKGQHFDSLAVGLIDFKKSSFESFEIHDQVNVVSDNPLYFDLASVTKALTSAAVLCLHPELMTPEISLLINHRAGIVWWGLLSNKSWRELLLSYEIKESETVYSDFGALRAMLEIEKKSGKSVYDLASSFWDKELCSWLDLKNQARCAVSGMRRGKLICGEVHDPNAYALGERVSHAGLFGTIDGVCKSLINLNKKCSFIEKTKAKIESGKYDRFIDGWDRVVNPNDTLAGAGAGVNTFGHLGFSGTSIWIDPDRMFGHVILSNATKSYWYDRSGCNTLRKELGAAIWSDH